ncbi:MAG: hypothetical protein QG671_1274 [Actinomycetota bacterium]|nr:hypothetical protein [Actinomycetota bacterium]
MEHNKATTSEIAPDRSTEAAPPNGIRRAVVGRTAVAVSLACIATGSLAASSAALAPGSPPQVAATSALPDASPTAARKYLNSGGSILLNTRYGDFGPILASGVGTVDTVQRDAGGGGTVTNFTVKGSPVADGGLSSYITWHNAQVSLHGKSTSGSVDQSTARVQVSGLQMDISGSLCAKAAGLQYCNTFTPAAPLRVYFSPTPTPDRASSVTTLGVVREDGTFDLSGGAYAKVDSSTLTGWALSKVVDGSRLTLNLDGMH